MKQFVAMTDEILYRLDGPPGPLVPYQCGVFCWHQLREEASMPPLSDLIRRPGANSADNSAMLSA